MSGLISDEIRRFVRAHIRSILQLEVLLLLARDKERWWSAEAVNRELRSSLDASLEQLERLGEGGLLQTRSGGEKLFRFHSAVSENVTIVAKLLELRRDRFHALVELIYARDRGQEFAQAFALKKPENDDG